MNSKYLRFEYEHDSESGKTKVWTVYSKTHNDRLGEIKWFAHWRQYCFFPLSECVFSAGCMAEVTAFIEQEKAKR